MTGGQAEQPTCVTIDLAVTHWKKLPEGTIKNDYCPWKLSLGRFVLPVLSQGMVSLFQGESCGLCGVHHSCS